MTQEERRINHGQDHPVTVLILEGLVRKPALYSAETVGATVSALGTLKTK